MTAKPLLIVISGPSGSGKGTLCAMLRQALPNLWYSVSVTTRQARPEERDGVDYFFVEKAEFEEMLDRGEFLEWAEVYGNCYGTSRKVVEEHLRAGRDVLLELDVQGARHIKEQFPGSLLIFIRPPSLQELGARIVRRGTETEETIRERLDLAPSELLAAENYDYEIVNDRPEYALTELLTIIRDAKVSASS